MPAPAVVWFRADLRLSDNPALDAAVRSGRPIVAVFIENPAVADPWRPGAASRWWLHHSLAALDASLQALGSRLVLRCGDPLSELRAVAQSCGAEAVYWNRRYEPALRRVDEEVKRSLATQGFEVGICNASLLCEPWEVATKSGGPFQVFTPFWRACRERLDPSRPLPAPRRLVSAPKLPDTLTLDAFELLPRPDWAAGMRRAWRPGEAGAGEVLRRLGAERVGDYLDERDFPGHEGTSRLSPYLHFGEVGPRQVWHALMDRAESEATPSSMRSAEGFLRQLGWREFAHHLLYHFPHTAEQPLRVPFAAFPWRSDDAGLRAWQRGRTGYPIVDAGMRELWETGWMHNRVRMVVASFLVKDLLLPWLEGARWFWDTLVDADLANNTLGWQWTAGCGADAAPYFRIFNPVAQGERFDPHGNYVRRWLPELSALPDACIHQPWKASAAVLHEAGVALGRDYPLPIVDHAAARERALQALASIRAGTERP